VKTDSLLLVGGAALLAWYMLGRESGPADSPPSDGGGDPAGGGGADPVYPPSGTLHEDGLSGARTPPFLVGIANPRELIQRAKDISSNNFGARALAQCQVLSDGTIGMHDLWIRPDGSIHYQHFLELGGFLCIAALNGTPYAVRAYRPFNAEIDNLWHLPPGRFDSARKRKYNRLSGTDRAYWVGVRVEVGWAGAVARGGAPADVRGRYLVALPSILWRTNNGAMRLSGRQWGGNLPDTTPRPTVGGSQYTFDYLLTKGSRTTLETICGGSGSTGLWHDQMRAYFANPEYMQRRADEVGYVSPVDGYTAQLADCDRSRNPDYCRRQLQERIRQAELEAERFRKWRPDSTQTFTVIMWDGSRIVETRRPTELMASRGRRWDVVARRFFGPAGAEMTADEWFALPHVDPAVFKYPRYAQRPRGTCGSGGGTCGGTGFGPPGTGSTGSSGGGCGGGTCT